MRKVACDYCGKISKYVDSTAVYRRSYGMIYYCEPCQAWVGVHRGTDVPLGRLANKELREAKKRAHAAFDPLWEAKVRAGHKKHKVRNAGYAWLAEQLGIDRRDCHIGMMDADTCDRVVKICQSITPKRPNNENTTRFRQSPAGPDGPPDRHRKTAGRD